MAFQPFESQGDYEVPLLRLLTQMPDGQGAVSAVCDRFKAEYADLIPAEHRAKASWGNDPLWKMHVRHGRENLKKYGFIDASVHGTWRITDAGRKWVAENPETAQLHGVRRPTTESLDSRRPKTSLAFPGITLEMLEQTRKAMPADQFRQVWGALYDSMVAQERARAISDITQAELGRRCRKRLDEIHSFLRGQMPTSPAGQILCDWIHFCYSLDLCKEAVALMPYVHETEVDAAIYKQAKRIADACRTKIAG